MDCSACSLFEAVLEEIYLCVSGVLFFRLLGVMDLNLRELVSKGKQNVSSALKSKKGELMQVSTVILYPPACCQDLFLLRNLYSA